MNQYGGATLEELSKTFEDLSKSIGNKIPEAYDELYTKLRLLSGVEFADTVVDIVASEHNTYDRTVMYERMETAIKLLLDGFSEDDVKLLLETKYEKVALILCEYGNNFGGDYMTCRNCVYDVLKTDSFDCAQFHWCDRYLDNYGENRAENCRAYKPKSNADKIRSMTDEELAKFLSSCFDCEGCSLSYIDDIYNEIQCGGKSKECHKNLLEWLKQETKGE